MKKIMSRFSQFLPPLSHVLVATMTMVMVLGFSFFSLRLITNVSQRSINEALMRHGTVQKAAVKIVERDIDDLELQLQRSLGKKTAMVGSFDIFPGKNGLQATHTEAPKSPIEIETSGKSPFAESLRLEKDVNFFVYTDEGTLVGALDSKYESEHLLFDLSKFARTVKSTSTRFATVDFSRVDQASLTLTHAIPGLKAMFLHPSTTYHVEATPVAKTNLVLVSLIPLSLSRRATAALFLPLFGSIFALAALTLLIYAINNRRRKRALKWLRDSLSGFRYGRIELKAPPSHLLGWDRKLMSEIQNQLSAQSPYSPIYAGRWLEAHSRVATWVSFRDTLSLWALREKVGHDVLIGQHWFVTRISVSRPALIDSAVRIFGRAFVSRSYIFNHYGEGEILLAARATHFEEWVEQSRTALRAWIEFEGLKANEIRVRGVFVSTADVELKTIFDKLEVDGPNPTQGQQNQLLTTPIAEFWDLDRPAAPIIEVSWMQALSLSLDKARHLYIVDEGVRGFMSVPRPMLPPPPRGANVKRPPPPKLPTMSATHSPNNNVGK